MGRERRYGSLPPHGSGALKCVYAPAHAGAALRSAHSPKLRALLKAPRTAQGPVHSTGPVERAQGLGPP